MGKKYTRRNVKIKKIMKRKKNLRTNEKEKEKERRDKGKIMEKCKIKRIKDKKLKIR